FSLGAEVQPPVGQDAVDVQDQHLDLRKRRGGAGFQNTPARSRSCTWSTPTNVPLSSSTISEVIRWVSIKCTASAARVEGSTDFGPAVITCSMRVACKSAARSSARRK